MAETSIDYIHGENYAVWYSDKYDIIRDMEEYLKNYPKEVSIISNVCDEDGRGRALTIKIPAKWVRYPRPSRGKAMTDEQREAMRERGRKLAAQRMAALGKG